MEYIIFGTVAPQPGGSRYSLIDLYNELVSLKIQGRTQQSLLWIMDNSCKENDILTSATMSEKLSSAKDIMRNSPHKGPPGAAQSKLLFRIC